MTLTFSLLQMAKKRILKFYHMITDKEPQVHHFLIQVLTIRHLFSDESARLIRAARLIYRLR